MNTNQKIILITMVLVISGMFLYPPFNLIAKNGTVLNMGYAWIFEPPRRGYLVANVNTAMLLIQWIGVIVVGGLIFVLAKSPSKSSESSSNGCSQTIEHHSIRNPENKSAVEGISFVLLRFMRCIVGFIFGWQAIGLLPVLTWFSNPSAITSEMVAIVVLKAVTMLLTGAMFYGLRKYIHWLHKRWYGLPHPGLLKALAL